MSRGAAGHQSPGGIWWNVATPASAATRTVRPGASGIAAATALDPIPPMRATPPSEYEEDDAAGSGRPVDVEEDDYGQLLRRPGEMPPRQQRLRQPGRPPPGQPGRFPPGGPGPARRPPAQRPTARRRAPRRPCRTAAPRTAAPCPGAARPRAGRSMAGRSTAGRSTAGLPMAGRCQVGSTGCRTGAGCRRARTALTGRRDPPRRAGHLGGTTGRVRLPRIRTSTAGAGRLLRRGGRRRAGRRQAAPFRQDRLLVRRTGVRSPPPAPASTRGTWVSAAARAPGGRTALRCS